MHLGGHLGVEAAFGRKLRGHKVTATELPDYIERVLKNFAAARQGEESFASWVTRAEDAELS